MEFYGKGREYTSELESMEGVVAAECETIRDETW